MNTIRPQPGPQERFLASRADIAIYGGAAGGGKSWALLLEALRHVRTRADFAAVFFRRHATQVRNPGGLWDESMRLYPQLGGKPVRHLLEWRWPGGGKVKFAHLKDETSVYAWQGAQIPLICFDELTHFSHAQFFYLLSRNRSACGVAPYVRASTNPDADSWVAALIDWWIDPDTGLPIAQRSGVLRWFVRIDEQLAWADSAQALRARYGDAVQPKSLTFVGARLDDNQALLAADPNYRANLLAQNAVERARLADGNWKVRPAAGLYFRRYWLEVVDAAPAGLEIVRYWDLAATPKTPGNDPDWTVGVKLGYARVPGIWFILDAFRLRESPLRVEQAIRNTASLDGGAVRIGLPQDPGQAGKAQAHYLVRQLAGYAVSARSESGDKVTRFGPFSAQCQAGNVKILRGAWNEALLAALEAFPEGAHDDDADACAGAFRMLCGVSCAAPLSMQVQF